MVLSHINIRSIVFLTVTSYWPNSYGDNYIVIQVMKLKLRTGFRFKTALSSEKEKNVQLRHSNFWLNTGPVQPLYLIPCSPIPWILFSWTCGIFSFYLFFQQAKRSKLDVEETVESKDTAEAAQAHTTTEVKALARFCLCMRAVIDLCFIQACKCAGNAGISGNFCPVVGGIGNAESISFASPTDPTGHNNNTT